MMFFNKITDNITTTNILIHPHCRALPALANKNRRRKVVLLMKQTIQHMELSMTNGIVYRVLTSSERHARLSLQILREVVSSFVKNFYF